MNLENSYAVDLEGLYVPHEPKGYPKPELVQLNEALAASLGLDATELKAGLFTGNVVPDSAVPLAMAYAGHQFGGFSPQLGDGRALLLGEVITPEGTRVDLHLKGSGPTPFSRGGDGRATLGPVLREYLMGEAMFHLGVPTTRALAAVTTGEQVRREGLLPGAVLARVASSHLRVGTFEFFAARGSHDKIERLVTYALGRHYPEGLDAERPALALLEGVARAQGHLIAKWMNVGFVHGVMNTDNTTISGETIDYGPCAFMDAYDPATVFSSIDHGGRYAYGRQPQIGLWNLSRLADSLLASIDPDQKTAIELAQDALAVYGDTYDQAFLNGFAPKLGLDSVDTDTVVALFKAMKEQKLDYTSTFRKLASALRSPAPSLLFTGEMAEWVKAWAKTTSPGAADRMDAVNPVYIARNHKVEEALDAAVSGDLGPFERLLAVLSDPFTVQQGAEDYAGPAPDEFGKYVTFCGT